jgi:predicted outer membrane repeat protein
MRISRPLAVLAVLVVTTFAWPATAQAATLTVGPGGGSGQCESPTYSVIQDAVDDASGNDTIYLCAGTYALATAIAVDVAVTFEGAGADVTVLDGGATHRIMAIDTSAVTVSGLTLRNGATTGDGGAISSAGPLTIRDSVFTGNSAVDSGGAVYAANGLSISGSTFSGNTAAGFDAGGAVYALDVERTVVIEGSTFSNNATGNRGGAVVVDGDVSISASTFTANSAVDAADDDGEGGAVYSAWSGADVVIEDSSFIDNMADRLGGAVLAEGPVTITGSTFSENELLVEVGIGGAVWADGLTVSASTFSRNLAKAGGALASTSGEIVVSGSTFIGNFASAQGSAIRTGAALVQAWNSTFVGNSAGREGDGGAIATDATVDLTNVTFSQNTGGTGAETSVRAIGGGSAANTIFGDPFGAGVDDGCGASGLSDGGGNLTTDATCPGAVVDLADLALQPLADNGGPTQTVALGAASVAIDAGVDAVCEASPVSGIDQRGYVRPSGAACDSGAYEYEAVPATRDPAQLPPTWYQAISRGSADACPTGYAPSWAQWPNGGQGGYTCEASVVYDPSTGKWVGRPGIG